MILDARLRRAAGRTSRPWAQFEAAFVSLAHTPDDLQRAASIAAEALGAP